MNSFEQFLDDRAEQHDKAAAETSKARVDWMLAKAKPEERLIAFDAWLCKQLAERLQWSCSDEAKERRIFQCKVEIERMLTQFYSRGWLLDGRRIARHISAVLDPIGKAQREGKVGDFWPYFKASVSRYAGANAEEIRAESQRAGNVMGNLLGALGVSRADSIVELVATRRSEIHDAKTLREKIAAQKKAGKAAAEPMQLDFNAPARRGKHS